MTDTGCVIVGGGPAGMMLGYLFGRAGIDVTVLEKHPDFFRDFRGDTVHPSTLEILNELGILEEFLNVPHQKVRRLRGQIGETTIQLADFSHLPGPAKFLAFMPQWDFLDFLAGKARVYQSFKLEMNVEVTDLVMDGNRVAGVRAKTPSGERQIRAGLVVGADGRHSIVREKAGLKSIDFGSPMDALWMRISRKPADPDQLLGRIDFGRVFVMIDRGDYWQCALVIRKGGFDEIQQRGLEPFRNEITRIVPFLSTRVSELRDWSDVKLLTVQVDRLRGWCRPGLLCIGDAAHAMSPIGGVGINLAIQDAVAAANILAPVFQSGSVPTLDDLRKVQKRRALPTRLTQSAQLVIQNRVITKVLGNQGRMKAPWIVRLMGRFPILQRIPARLVGLGFRREHVSQNILTRPAPR